VLQIVGEGVFKSKYRSKYGEDPVHLDQDEVRKWAHLAARCILYRVAPELDPPTSYSGMVLYTEGQRQDRTVGPAVVGLQSFVQYTGTQVQPRLDMEEADLKPDLRDGFINFYGAFEVPEQLRANHRILCTD
jgi:hypothetical protein